MHLEGILIGSFSFLIIGLFHPIVIKTEYYFGKKVWPIFLIFGMIALGISLLIPYQLLSVAIGVIGFSSLWSIHELIEQEQRVKRGWFPKNPKKI